MDFKIGKDFPVIESKVDGIDALLRDEIVSIRNSEIAKWNREHWLSVWHSAFEGYRDGVRKASSK